MGEGDFTLKEKLIEIHKELREFRRDSMEADKGHDDRIKELEGFRSSLLSNIKLAGWVVGVMIGGGGLLIAKFFIQ